VTSLLFSLFVGPTALASPDGVGSAMQTGARVELTRHFALGFDFGYGLMSAAPRLQDRWWLMPSAAFVLPLGRLRLELGAGLGLGTSSAFASWTDYSHDHNDWEWQAVPTVRAHAMAGFALTERLGLYARAEAAAMLYRGPLSVAQSTWLDLGAGVTIAL
jgi:hypothetical protein